MSEEQQPVEEDPEGPKGGEEGPLPEGTAPEPEEPVEPSTIEGEQPTTTDPVADPNATE